VPRLARILLCDHRGEGLSESLLGLSAVGYVIEVSQSVRESRERLATLAPDLVILDPLAGGGSLELGQIQDALSNETRPLLLVADPINPLPVLLTSRSAGEWPVDIVHRDAPFEEFLLRIERLHRSAEGAAELDEMRYRAAHDDRTDLLRPAIFQTRLREHFSAAQRHQLDLALALLDLDDFGSINKQFDHTVGDQVITSVGAVIRDSLRTEDVGGRIGGDEFAIILPYTRRVDAARVVHRMKEAVRSLSGPLEMPGGGRSDVSIRASIGFETYNGLDLESVETLRRHSEFALRAAKRRGGSCAVYYRNIEPEAEGEEDRGGVLQPEGEPSGLADEDGT
jgi:diguanylate cyclase (GGDEF)-like protein